MKTTIYLCVLMLISLYAFGQKDTTKTDTLKYTTHFTYEGCSSLTLNYPSQVSKNSSATIEAIGCKGQVVWYLNHPQRGGKILYEGEKFIYPIEKETTFYAACRLSDGNVCLASIGEATVKIDSNRHIVLGNISSNSYLPPTPTVSSFVRYGELPVSYHTGTVDVSIPLYTVSCKDVSMDVSLSYHGSGNKVSDVSSWIGLGMSLNAGGVISRTVQGTADEGQGSPYSVGYYARSQAGSYYPSYNNGVYNTSVQWAIPRPSNYPNSPDCNNLTINATFLDAMEGRIDTEPDLFFFNVGGYSGKFMFDSLAVAHLFPEQDVKIEAIYSGNGATGTFEQFKLTTPDGTKYYFGGTHGNTDYPQGSTAIEQSSTDATNPIPTAWYLTKIESANSHSAIYLSYQSEQYSYFELIGESANTDGGGFTPPQTFTKNKFLGVRISNIYTSDKQTQLNFKADSLRKDVGEYTLGEYSPGYSEAKYLNQIEVLAGGVGVKRFVLRQDYFQASEGNIINSFKPLTMQNNPTFYQSDRKRLRLLSVQEQSWDGYTVVPAYQFNYDSTIVFPRRLCYSRDHWGYYNGNEFIGSGVNNSLIHRENGDGITGVPTSYLFWYSNRSTNPAYVGFGALLKIMYPTGGYTVFEYGNHQRGSYAPSLNIGGLRILSMSNYDMGGNRVGKKRFDYLSSGILYTKPTYFYTALQIGYYCLDYNPCPTGCPNSMMSSSTLLPLSSTQGSHIGYRQVKVFEVDESDNATNGYTLYTYNTDLPINDNMTPNSYDDFGALRLYNYPLNPTRENYRQGTLALEEVLNNSNNLVSKTSYQYQYSSKIVPIPAMRVDNHTVGNMSSATHYYNFYRFKTGRSELKSKVMTRCQDDGSNCVVTTETYDYGSSRHFQKTRTSEGMSNGDSLIRTYQYSLDYVINPSVSSWDAGSSGIKGLQLAHKIVPIEELNLLKTSGGTVVMSGSLTEYDGIALKPSKTYALEVTNPFLAQSSFVTSSVYTIGSQAVFNKDTHYPTQANVSLLYNGLGNVIQTEEPQGSGIYSSYLWGYGGSYLIAELKNTPHTTVLSTLGVSVIANLEQATNLTDTQIQSQLSPIWGIPNSFNTVYTYLPLRGISSMTESNQLKTTFSYDNLSRLTLTKDHDNNKLSEYEYVYRDTQNQGLNRITTKQYRFPHLGNKTQTEPDYTTTHGYLDGLGRPLQTVGEMLSPLAKDIVLSNQTYDKYGRVNQTLAVFPTNNNTGGYVSNGLSLGQAFYGDMSPNTLSTYENSPLNRLRRIDGVGSAWRMAGKKTLQYDETAGIDVRSYTIDGTGNITLNGSYPANSLYKKRTIDEQGNATIEITDKRGRLIQKQQQNGTDWLTTYYINDGLGRVLAVLQPNAYALNSSISQGSADWSNGVFFYKYDNRGRTIEKHIPNGGFSYMVYDKADREVLNQDEHQRTLNRWSFTKYDNLSRAVISGELTNNSNRTSLQSQFDSQTTLSESFNSSLPSQLYYTNISYPFGVDSSQAMEVNYYDSYNTWRGTSFQPTQTYYNNATGLLTGKMLRYTENRKWLTEAFYHNTKNRVTESRKQDAIGNVESLVNVYRFLGGLFSHTRLYGTQFFGSGGLYFSKSYGYDIGERRVKSTTYLAPTMFKYEDIIIETQYAYNEIGQLITKKFQPNRKYQIANMGQDYIYRPPVLTEANTQDIANRAVIISPGFNATASDVNTNTYVAEIDTTHQNGLTDAMQIVNYGYHIRGQMNCMNCRNKQVYPNPKENDFFSMKLDFEDDKRYYDGNISRQTWKSPQIAKKQVFTHSYDGVSRLTKSVYSGGVANSNYSMDSIAYDRNGNIQLLKRRGIDNLTYTYNGNQLLSVTDNTGTTAGFNDGNTSGNDYGYWANGSLKFDKNKGIDSIVYHSYLKRVSRVKWTNGNWVNFFYDASGTLIKRKLSNGTTWMYRGDLLMKNDTLYQVNHEEGRVTFDKLNQKWITEFDYRDHLGNLRVSFRDSLAEPVNGVYKPPVVTQVDEIDPTGVSLSNLNYAGINKNNFGFINRETFAETGWINLNHRFYMPDLMRFGQTDPIIEGQEHLSLYQYSFNNPVRFSDPNGLMGKGCCGGDPSGALLAEAKSQWEAAKSYGRDLLQKAENGLATVLSYTDVNDATVLVTTVTRGENAINIDGSKATTADKWAAAGGAVLPLVSGSAVKKVVGAVVDKVDDVISTTKVESKGARFISDTDGKIIDTHSTPKGSYTHADGSRTDVLQDKSHFNKAKQENHGTTHTHEPYSNTNPKTGKTYTGADDKATHRPTYKEVKDIESGVSKRN